MVRHPSADFDDAKCFAKMLFVVDLNGVDTWERELPEVAFNHY